jgi:hypothetical protein
MRDRSVPACGNGRPEVGRQKSQEIVRQLFSSNGIRLGISPLLARMGGMRMLRAIWPALRRMPFELNSIVRKDSIRAKRTVTFHESRSPPGDEVFPSEETRCPVSGTSVPRAETSIPCVGTRRRARALSIRTAKLSKRTAVRVQRCGNPTSSDLLACPRYFREIEPISGHGCGP